MIDLTPLEVRQKKGDFRRAFRGYDSELVNDFLDLAADRMEELTKENMVLTERVDALETEVREFREKERSLSEALMTAQRLREDARSLAEKEGELLIREARSAAESARDEAARGLAREEEALRQVRARRAQLVDSFRRFLERELTELAVIEDTLELKPEAGAPAGQESPAATAPSARPEAAGKPAGKKGAEPSESGAKKAESASPPEPARGKAEPQAARAGEDDGESGQPPAGDEDDWLSSLVEETQRDGP